MQTEIPKPRKGCYTADIIQYMMPNGRRVPISTNLPIESLDSYLDMKKHGYRLAAEMLRTGEISVTIEGHGRDADIRVIPNGPDVQGAMVEMLGCRLWNEPYNNIPD